MGCNLCLVKSVQLQDSWLTFTAQLAKVLCRQAISGKFLRVLLPPDPFQIYIPMTLQSRGQLLASVNCHSSATSFSLPSQRTCALLFRNSQEKSRQLPVSRATLGKSGIMNLTPQPEGADRLTAGFL